MTEKTAQTKCRRCSECMESEHHWLSDPRPDVDDDATDEQLAAAEYVWQCKHCPATKPYDPDEEDEDSDYDDEDWDISLMVGRTIVAITGGQDAEGQLTAPSGCVEIILDDGAKVRMSHTQDCCESVELVDIAGDVADLIGSPLTMAEEARRSPLFVRRAAAGGPRTAGPFGHSLGDHRRGKRSRSATVRHRLGGADRHSV